MHTAHPTPTITAHAKASGTTTATAVDVFVQIEGSNWVMGNAVLEQAREVNELVKRAVALGIAATAFTVEAMQVRTESGLFSKSTQATYDLKVSIDDLGHLPAFLGAISDVRKAEMQRLSWRYGQENAVVERLLGEATRVGAGRARAMAAALGVGLGQVVAAEDAVVQQLAVQPPWSPPPGNPSPMSRNSKAAATPDFGFAMGHAKTLEVSVTLKFEVAAV